MTVLLLSPPVLKLDANGALPLGYTDATEYAAKQATDWINDELPGGMPTYATPDFMADLTEIIAQALFVKLSQIQGVRK